ncbi:rhomboid family intramembrane serine protease [Natronospora cellulosivora (SeqCode)]
MKVTNTIMAKKSLTFGSGTLTIFLINVVFFIMLRLFPEFSQYLLLNPRMDLILARPWTLITVFFSHEIFIHIIANMGLFLIFGNKLEKITNGKTVIMVYLLTGFVGSLTFPFFAPIIQWTGPVVGASAATWGIASAFAMMRPNYKFYDGESKVLTSLFGLTAKLFVVLLFVINIIIFILNPSISIGAAAHAAGIIVGGICGYWLETVK